jgi:hypothetical protein
VNDRNPNLKPWPKGVSGNPGGRPKKKAITEELERLLEEEAPNSDGKTWAATVAEALLRQAAKGDVRAITELANRIEGKPAQPVAAEVGGLEGLAEAIAEGRKRVARVRDGKMADQKDQRQDQSVTTAWPA